MDLEEYLQLQNQEIERHKWLESEKAGRDVGVEAAIDWILKYAHQFSEYYCQSMQRKTLTSAESVRLVSHPHRERP